MNVRSMMCAAALAVACIPAPVAAQVADPVMESLRPHYERAKEYLLASADQLSDDDLGFRPTAEVRSALALLAHIADSQHFFCSAALGESTPHETHFEREETQRERVIQALRESFGYCDQAYAQSDADVVLQMRAFGGDRPRLSALVLNTTHNWEHYGNIVTYMRIRGKVPPSSQPR